MKKLLSKHYYNGRDFKFVFFKKQKKMEQLKNVEENIYSSAVAIRKELEELHITHLGLPRAMN